MALLSIKNSSTVPILANGIFQGTYENVTNYSTAVVTVYGSTRTQLTVYQSQLGTVPASHVQYQIPSNVRESFDVQVAYPYLYLTLDNLDSSNQTFLNLCTIYRNTSVIDVSATVSLPTIMDVCVTNFPAKQSVSDAALLNNGTVVLYNDDVTVGQLSGVMNLSNGPVNGLSIYGTCYVDNSCRLQVMYSPNDSNWFGTQYINQINNSGDFGFNLPATGASYVALKLLDNNNSIDAWGEYRA